MRTKRYINPVVVDNIIDYIVPVLKTNTESVSWNHAIDMSYDDPVQRELRKKQLMKKLKDVGIHEPLAVFAGSSESILIKLTGYTRVFSKEEFQVALEILKRTNIVMQCGSGVGKLFFLLKDTTINRTILLNMLTEINFSELEVVSDIEAIELNDITKKILDRNSFLEEKLKLVELEKNELASKLQDSKKYAWP